jgi:predicted phage terminase large subunit-like protein
MFIANKKYSPELFTAESGMIQKSIGPFLDEAMRKRGFINLNPVTPTKDKVARARSIQGRIRTGTVFFDKEADWYPEFEQELITFPRGAHDDQVDALAWIGLTLDDVIEAETQEELDDDEWEEEYGMFSIVGRNAMTGY